MDVLDQLNAVRKGDLSRRAFNKTLAAAGISLVVSPMASRIANAAAADQGTYFTWGGYDVPEMFGTYIKKHGEAPNFATFGGSEEALTKIRGGFVVDVVVPDAVGPTADVVAACDGGVLSSVITIDLGDLPFAPDDEGGAPLPRTGSSSAGPLARLGAALLGVGALMVILAGRRREDDDEPVHAA